MKILLSLLLFAYVALPAQQVQKSICGKIIHIEKFQSKFIEPRNIDIWLPEHYSPKNKYLVLYMHDGQMLFDSSITWNRQSWDVDDIACKLLETKKLKNFIVVGIWNNGEKRHQDYFPQKPFETLSNSEKDSISEQLKKGGVTKNAFHPNSDNYLKFIVTELVPFIDQNYSVSATKKHNFMAGSSMGGLISIYAICEYPNVFEGVACLSTHWPGSYVADNSFPGAMMEYLKKNLPNPADHKIYFDHGDQTQDAIYEPFQKRVDEIMVSKGYDQTNSKSLIFQGKDHSEKSWHERFEIPLLFLLHT